METDQAAILRIRAANLRVLALRIIVTPAHLLATRAGESTWVGPTPRRCQEELLRMHAELTRASDGLIADARRFEVQADLLETTSGAAGPKVR